MSNVIVDREKIDILANAISDKSGVPLTMTLDEMVEAVDSIEIGGGAPILQTITKTYTPSTSAVTDTIMASSGYDGIKEVDVTVSAVPVGSAMGPTSVYTTNVCSPFKTNNFLSVATVDGAHVPTTPSITKGYISSATESKRKVIINTSIPYNPTLTVSGDTVTIPSGYYSSQTTKSVLSGTEGTPTATKGAVSNHSVSVTPSVTNTTGYITGSTINGTAVTVSASELVSGSETKTENGTYDVTNLAELIVNVPTGSTINNQNKTVTPSETQQSVSADSGYTGLGTVTIGAISSTYVGSGITQRSSSDLTASGATVTVPSGYYASSASKSVSSGSLTGASIILETGSRISTATNQLILAKDDVSYSVISSGGYIGEGNNSVTSNIQLRADCAINSSLDLTVSGAIVTAPAGYYAAAASKSVASGSASAPSSISGTSASVTTGTNTLTLTKTVSVTPVVSAGYVSSGTATNSSVSLTASVTTKAAATITPTTTNQTIAAGTYLTGAQTIAGDADLIGSNILSTANIFGVQGTVDFIDVYVRSTAPTSSVGNDGDIYIQE